MIAVGTDLVDISAFGDQLAQEGTRFEQVFSPRELRRANERDGFRRVEHLAGRWAAKEAFIKAWSQLLYGQPPAISEEDVVFSDITVVPDAWGRVAVVLEGMMARAFEVSVGDAQMSLSISHDGTFAVATCVICCN